MDKKERTKQRQSLTRKVRIKNALRLERERPDLFEKVISKKLSINKAATLAGFQTERVSMPLDAEKIVESLKRHFSRDDLEYIAITLLFGMNHTKKL